MYLIHLLPYGFNRKQWLVFTNVLTIVVMYIKFIAWRWRHRWNMAV